LSSKSIDFVLAFPQADLEVPVYMELPMGFDVPENESQKHYVLRLNKRLYGLKQAGYNCFKTAILYQAMLTLVFSLGKVA
jgi:hypothetical protein